jgi:CheY-like chemotaxis protein
MDLIAVKEKLANKSLLYVEDELSLQKQYADIFELFFKKIYLAQDGVEALEIYKQHQCDIIITDIKMMQMDGNELFDKIKDINQSQIIISMAAEYSIHASTSDKFDAWINKPASVDDIFDVLLNIVS